MSQAQVSSEGCLGQKRCQNKQCKHAKPNEEPPWPLCHPQWHRWLVLVETNVREPSENQKRIAKHPPPPDRP
eukprot:7504131-Prorocentrum_lima.AAC.1